MLTEQEKHVLEDFRRGNDCIAFVRQTSDWISFGLRLLLEIGHMVRSARVFPAQETIQQKNDGSAVTDLEKRIEIFARECLSAFRPEASFIGEESGGDLPDSGYALALDPIDGTWSFVNQGETCATSLAVFQDKKPIIGMVVNSATGEIGYSSHGGKTRLLQLSIFKETDIACHLPSNDFSNSKPLLINLHPSRKVIHFYKALNQKWEDRSVRMVKSTGGSPAWFMLEAAKGHYVYINNWIGRLSEPYDIAAGILLVQGAGGQVVDLEGNSIPSVGYQGVIVAGISEHHIETVIGTLRGTSA